MPHNVGDRVCITGMVTTNNYPQYTDGVENDFRTDDYTNNNACGYISRILLNGYVAIKLDNGRYAPEVEGHNVLNPNNSSNPSNPFNPSSINPCDFKIMDYVVVSGTTITKTHPYATLFTMKSIQQMMGTVIKVNNDGTFLIKFNDELFGIDVPCYNMGKYTTNLLLNLAPTNPTPFLPIVNGTTITSSYPLLNSDAVFQKEVVRFFRNRIVDNWIYDKLKPLLGYFTVIDGKVKWLPEINPKPVEDTVTEMDLKAEFIKRRVLTKKMIRKIIEKFIEENDVNWYDLKKFQNELKTKFLLGLNKQFHKIASSQ